MRPSEQDTAVLDQTSGGAVEAAVPSKHVHIVLQAKGGAGKTVAAALLAQYYDELEGATLFLDTDPFNTSFHAYKGLRVQAINVFNANRDAIDQRSFDQLVNLITAAKSGSSVVIDTGSGNFQDLMTYMIQNDFVRLLQSAFGCQVYFHIVIAGGVMFSETMTVFGDILDGYPEPEFIVWLNEYPGSLQTPDGIRFEDTKVVEKHGDKIAATVRLSRRHASTFEHDLQEMMRQRLTFSEAVSGAEFDVMAKHRLAKIWSELFAQFEQHLPTPPASRTGPELTVVEGKGHD